MMKKASLILMAIFGLSLLSYPAIADVSSGNEEISQEKADLVIDSLHTQEPPGIEVMVTTYYSRRFHGRKTASGERYDQANLTCAHKYLPFNTLLQVTNPNNGKSVVVRVNDRGPFPRGRHLDLSYAAAKELDMIRAGVIRAEVQLLPMEKAIEESIDMDAQDFAIHGEPKK